MKKVILVLFIIIGQVLYAQNIEKFSIDSGGSSASVGNIELLYTIGEVNVQEVGTLNISISEGFINPLQLKLTVNPKLFLQGPITNPLVSGQMNDYLRSNGLIPTTSPYTDGLVCNATVFTTTGANAIVDWVWVSLRDQNDLNNVIEGQSALLQRDGDVVAIDGVSTLLFNSLSGNYYISVNHRNHLGIISASAIGMNSTPTVVDFTTNTASVLGDVNALTLLSNGKYAIYAGDFDDNIQVQSTDATGLMPFIGGYGYSAGDMDANSEVQTIDLLNMVYPNIGRGQQFSRTIEALEPTTNLIANINYTFTNTQNTLEDGITYYEADVLIASSEDFKLGAGQLYFNYNTAAFGSNINLNSKVEFTAPNDGYILGEFNVLPVYTLHQLDNTDSRVSFDWIQSLSSGAMVSNNVTIIPTLLVHIKIAYTDANQDPMICFESDDSVVSNVTDLSSTACGPTTFATADCTNFPGIQLLNNTFNCTDATLSVSTNELANFIMYPNPATGEFYIKGLQEKSTLSIYDLNGRLVFKQIDYLDTGIDISRLESAIYMVKVENSHGVRIKRLIKK